MNLKKHNEIKKKKQKKHTHKRKVIGLITRAT